MKDANSASPTVSGAIALALAASMLSGSKNASLDAKIAWPPAEERISQVFNCAMRAEFNSLSLLAACEAL